MKKKLKQLFSFVICLIFISSFLGCSSNKNVNSDNNVAQVTQSVSQDTEETESNIVSEETSSDTEEPQDTKKTLTEDEIKAIHLKDIYSEYGIKVGTCLSDQMIKDSKYTDIINSQFNSITMENLMKPDYILNQSQSQATGDIVVEFNSNTISLLNWAKENGMSMRGHTLIWYSQTPSWIFYDNFTTSGKLVDRDTMLKRMESYIKQVFQQIETLGYTDLFYAYDVVNEALMEDGSYRSENNNWYNIIGEDYIWYAFFYANEYAPENCSLFYNDYNEQYKTDALVKLAQSLVDEQGNSLIDGIGLQAHLYTEDSLSTYLATVKTLCALDLQIQVTELDVSLGSWKNPALTTEETLIQQGKYYYDLLDGILKIKEETNGNINSITFWGFTDSLSWRSNNSPLLYDKSLNEKYSFFGAALMKEYAGY